jgi:hypothetical protein
LPPPTAPPPSPTAAPAPLAADLGAPAPPTAAITLAAPAPPPAEEGHHGHTWIWIALGAAVVGGAVGAYVALRAPATVPPTTTLGNYKF